ELGVFDIKYETDVTPLGFEDCVPFVNSNLERRLARGAQRGPRPGDGQQRTDADFLGWLLSFHRHAPLDARRLIDRYPVGGALVQRFEVVHPGDVDTRGEEREPVLVGGIPEVDGGHDVEYIAAAVGVALAVQRVLD